jgi:hypothetical protein
MSVLRLLATLSSIALSATAVGAAPLALTPLFDRRRRRALRRLVPAACAVLDAHGIDYWADFGTLLGFHRESDIILSDKDADLSVMASEQPQILALAEAFRAAGLDITDRGGRSRRVLRIHDTRTRFHLDIYTFVRDGDLLRSELSSPGDDIPAHLVEHRMSAPFLGGSIRVPADVEAVVRYRYGDAYRMPRRNDKGTARRYSAVRSILEDVEAGWVGLWSWLRSPGSS